MFEHVAHMMLIDVCCFFVESLSGVVLYTWSVGVILDMSIAPHSSLIVAITSNQTILGLDIHTKRQYRYALPP